jgi:nucleoside-diphosphate-sugar epimerase
LSNELFLVTGANGFIGITLCSELKARGMRVRCAVRESAKFSINDCDVVEVAGLGANTDWSGALQDVSVVIHLAARVHVMHDTARDPLDEFRRINVAGTLRLARQAAANGVKRFVFVSSVKVNGESTAEGHSFREIDAPAPRDPYGISKSEAEAALRQLAVETGMEVVIVRPPLLYGPEVKGNFAQMLGVLSKGTYLPLASVRNLRSFIYVGNMADALISCATHPAAANQTYLVSDGVDVSTPDLLKMAGEAMGRPARLIPFPTSLLRLAGRLAGKTAQIDRLLGSLRIDSGKIRRELNWTPPYTMQQGLRATAEWYRNTHP